MSKKKSIFLYKCLIVFSLFTLILIFADDSSAYVINIDVSGGSPIISGDNLWPDTSVSYDELNGRWDVTLSISGAHRGWPDAPYSRVALIDPESGDISSALRLYNVLYSNLYSWSWYDLFVYIGTDPGWTPGNYSTFVRDGSYQLVYPNLKTDLGSYNIYFRDTGSSVPIPTTIWLLGSALLGLLGIQRRIR